MLIIALHAVVQGGNVPLPLRRFTAPPQASKVTGPIEQAEISPPFSVSFMCAERFDGQLGYAGDALGTDCVVTGGSSADDGYERPYRTDGKRNEDWFGWRAEVLAPFDGVVIGVNENTVVNRPGMLGKPPAGIVQIQRADGTVVLYAHVTSVRVAFGAKVRTGQVIASVGNNGFSRSPHLHVGAYRGTRPLQIRWDLRAMARLRKGSE